MVQRVDPDPVPRAGRGGRGRGFGRTGASVRARVGSRGAGSVGGAGEGTRAGELHVDDVDGSDEGGGVVRVRGVRAAERHAIRRLPDRRGLLGAGAEHFGAGVAVGVLHLRRRAAARGHLARHGDQRGIRDYGRIEQERDREVRGGAVGEREEADVLGRHVRGWVRPEAADVYAGGEHDRVI